MYLVEPYCRILPGNTEPMYQSCSLYTPSLPCLNRSMTEKDFQRIQELLTTSLSAVEGRINNRIDKLEREIKDVCGEIKGVRDEIKDVRSSMEESFDAIEAQFNEIDTRFAALDEKIDRNHQEVTKRIDTLSKHIESQHQDTLEAKGALRLLTTQHEDLAGRVAVVESRLQAA